MTYICYYCSCLDHKEIFFCVENDINAKKVETLLLMTDSGLPRSFSQIMTTFLFFKLFHLNHFQFLRTFQRRYSLNIATMCGKQNCKQTNKVKVTNACSKSFLERDIYTNFNKTQKTRGRLLNHYQ